MPALNYPGGDEIDIFDIIVIGQAACQKPNEVKMDATLTHI
jgi:hypothetical protein